MNQEIIDILTTLYKVVRSEEQGCTEHICEYFSSDELEDIFKENNIQVGSNLEDSEIDEAIEDFLKEKGTKFSKCSEAAEWLEKTDMNEEAKKKFIEKLNEII